MRKPAVRRRRVLQGAEFQCGEGCVAHDATHAVPSARQARGALPLAALLLLALSLAGVLSLAPSAAWAADYTMPKVDIEATVGADGSLHVVEERTFSYTGGSSEAVFAFDVPYSGELEVNGVWVGDPDDIDQNGNVISTPLQRVSFDLDWRDDKGTGPTVSSYAVDDVRDAVYVFFSAADESCVVTVDYTVENALGVYRDVGELYWSYVNSNWEVDSQNVTLTVRLPVPEGADIVPNETVRAWGHGPEDGTVAINADGSVTYACPTVRSGQYAAARVVFPTEWLSAVPQKVRLEHQATEILDSVIAEEAAWSDTASSHREGSLTLHAVVVAASVLLLLASAIMWACCGKERRPRWAGGVWDRAPEPGMHPAVVGRLWRLDRASSKDLVASVMRTVSAGLVGLRREEAVNGVNGVQVRWFLTRKTEGSGIAGPKGDGGSELTAAERLDEATVSLLFDDIAEGARTLAFDGIVRGADAIPRQYVEAVRAWQDALSAEVRTRGLFDERGWRLQAPVVAIGTAWALLGVGAWLFQNDTALAWAMIPAGALVAFIGAHLPRRSQEGADLNAKCEALRAWLAAHPASESDEREGLEACAYVLGVRSSEMAAALEAAFDEAWKTAREGVRVRRA